MDIKSLLKRTGIITPALTLALGLSAITPAIAATTEPAIKAIDFKLLSDSNKIAGNRFIVKYRDIQTPGFGAPVLSQYDIETFTPLFYKANKLNMSLNTEDFSKWHLVKFKSGQNIQQAYEDLKSDPNVESITPDWILKANLTPNDLDEQLWGLSNSGQQAQKWGDYIDNVGYDTYFEAGTPNVDISAAEAWDIKTDSSDVIVAVIDTGIDYNHEDLTNNMWVNSGEIAGNGIDDDNNGYIDDVYGYNFAYDNSDPMDDNGHGTHCAGIIAAEGNNGIGIAGVSWNSNLMALKVLDISGNGYISDIAKAIIYATNMGAKVSNNSYGSFFNEQELFGRAVATPLTDAFTAANEAGMVAAIAAGNSRTNLDDIDSTSEELSAAYPANVNLPNIISVVATDADDVLAPFSNYGFADTDIAAPGVGIYSTMPGNSYDLMSGTSMATPYVAGAAALLMSQHPELKPYEVRAIIMESGDSVPNLQDITVSGKRLNLYSALTHLSTDTAQCDSFTSTVSEHEAANRAYSQTETSGQTCWGTFCWGGATTTTYYAEGSDENLGTTRTAVVTLIENTPGIFSTSSNCEGGNDLPPVIALNGEVNDYILLGSQFQDSGATATDREDGDISANITVTGSVNSNAVGNYPLTYEVTDSSGNNAVKVTRFVNVRETDGAPHIYVVPAGAGDAREEIVYHRMGTEWDDPGYFAWDRIEGDLTSQATIATLDIYSEGINQVEYSVADSQGNTATSYRNVAVIDENKPFIMTTSNPQNVFTFSSDDVVEYVSDIQQYNEKTGRCPVFGMFSMPVDLNDGTNGTIISTGEANLCEAGIYNIDLSFTDSDGYTDTQTIRITVSDGSSSCVTAKNSDHIAANRAELKYNVLVYANGSQNYLGMGSDTSSLEETSAGTWTKVTTCP